MEQPLHLHKRIVHLIREIPQRPILTTSIVLFFVIALLLSISLPLYQGKLSDYMIGVLMEAHGMIFDIAVIGILILWLNKSGEKQINIRNNHNEIDDFRDWKSPEASYRILGAIKRLNREDIYKIDLHEFYLITINLSYINFQGSNINYADLGQVKLIDAMLDNTRLNQANLENATLNKASLRYAFLSGANLTGVSGLKANFENAFLVKANFRNSHMINANFRGTDLSGADFENAHLYMADFTGAQGLTVEQLSHAKNLIKAKFDEELLNQLKMLHPELLENVVANSMSLA